jgi:uracil-DNA glycosylase family 4
MSDSDENATPDVDVRRLILQTLESWSAAGITHLATVAAIIPEAPDAMPTARTEPDSAVMKPSVEQTTTAQSGSTQPGTIPPSTNQFGATQFRSESSPEMAKKPAASPKSLLPVAEDETKPAESTQPLTFDQRVIELKILSDRVSKCTRCDELAATRTQTVFGVGNPEAKVVFIGEAPGADEDEQGEPFVGKAGQLLNKIIEAMKLTREEIYICNVLRCRPPGNRLPEATEAANCREYLDGQLRIINPEYIVCWGSCAAQNLLGSTESIGKLRKRWFQYNRARVLCTYHPSYLLRNPAAKKDVWEDMQLLMKELGIPVS